MASGEQRFLCGLFVVCALCATAGADLIGANDPNQPAGDDGYNLTRDTDTDLDWLDLTITEGLHPGYVATQLGSGEFAGYRFATRQEVITLFRHGSGRTGPPWYYYSWYLSGYKDQALYDKTGPFIDLVGRTDGYVSSYSQTDIAYGYVSNGVWSYPSYAKNYRYASPSGYSYVYPYWYVGGYASTYHSTSGKGVWLVRQAPPEIPEPATLALVGTGLAMLGWARRQRELT